MIASNAPDATISASTLFRGRNSVIRPTAALEAAVTGRTNPTGSSDEVGWTLCRTASELAQTLQRGGSLGVGLGPLPLLHAKMEFFESLKTTVFSLSLVVRARKVTQALEVSDVSLREGLSVPTSSADLDSFVALYGDSFVSAVTVGGELFGVYTFYAQSREQARSVEAAFGGGVNIGGISIGPELLTRIGEVSRSVGVNTSFRFSVSGLSSHPVIEPGTLIDFANRFASLPIDDPAVLDLETRGYELVAALQQAFRPVATNRRLFTGNGGEGLLRTRQRLREQLNQMNWVAGTYAVYGIPADPSLATNRALVQGDVQALEATKQAYGDSPSTRLIPPALNALQIGTPTLDVVVRDGEKMGGDGGQHSSVYQDRSTAIQMRKRLAEVSLKGQARIDQIRLTYTREGDAPAAPGLPPEKWGGEGGRDLGTLQLGPGVGIARIQAKTGTRVDQLFLTSSDGQRLGGGGNEGNRVLDWSVPSGSVVLGFHGNWMAEVDALTPVVAEFRPLQWQPIELLEDT